jgi:hypothetical protein
VRPRSGRAADVLDRLARYAAILNDGLRVRVTREGKGTLCRFDALDGLDIYLTRAPATRSRRCTPASRLR